jgi:hypothetical protein
MGCYRTILSKSCGDPYVQEVQTQQNRDATEIPGLSKAALSVLRDVREARLMGEIQREGEGYDARARRREEMVAAAWQKGRADPPVAGELDRFMLAASQRLGPEGEQTARRFAPRPAAERWICPASGASTGPGWTSYRTLLLSFSLSPVPAPCLLAPLRPWPRLPSTGQFPAWHLRA